MVVGMDIYAAFAGSDIIVAILGYKSCPRGHSVDRCSFRDWR